MIRNKHHALPIFDCDTAAAYEARLLPDEASEWAAMQRVGRGIGAGILEDFLELRPIPEHFRVLALIGKGNNAGDALLACSWILARHPRAKVILLMATPVDSLKPLAARAYADVKGRVDVIEVSESTDAPTVTAHLERLARERSIDVCIDGLLGMSFKPPVRAPMAAVIEAVNAFPAIRLRAAVDLPSGCGDESAPDGSIFRSDFTYATGIAKTPLFEGLAERGRVRLIDLGFFEETEVDPDEIDTCLLLPSILHRCATLRAASTDKRGYGHLFVLAGSSFMPGALLMSVKAAVLSGVGRITAFVPAAYASAFAAQVPEAMWVPWPEAPSGRLSGRGLPNFYEMIGRASAVLMGPGLGGERQMEAMLMEMVLKIDAPLVLDADALRPRILENVARRKATAGPVVVTPHRGEYGNVLKKQSPDFSHDELRRFCLSNKVTTVLKEPFTRICDGATIWRSGFGGPVLARGGSGDLLAGTIAGMLAQDASDPLEMASCAVALHGMAADASARHRGQRMTRTCDVLDHYHEIVRQF